MVPSPRSLPESLDGERRFLWGLCYRMTGSAADAEDLVQETFVRAIEHPPKDRNAPIRPWLVTVAMNLARDHLRRRKRRHYPGVWLPEPLEESETFERQSRGHDDDPEARYGMMESASFAFLYALEALTPSQRAVLLLRDAFDWSSRETAGALSMSEENVRITLHRARKAMEDYDRGHLPLTRESAARVQSVMQELLRCLATKDLEGARALFATDARALSDGGGVHHAAGKPVLGAERIVKMYGNLATRASAEARVAIEPLNGAAAFLGEDPAPRKPNAPRFAMFIDLDDTGRIRSLFSVLAPRKLARLTWFDKRVD